MKCNATRELASELYEGTLDPEAHAELEHHLRACGSCREAFGEFARATDALRSLAAPRSSAEHVQDVMAALPPASESARSLPRAAGLVLAALAGAAAVLLVWFATASVTAHTGGVRGQSPVRAEVASGESPRPAAAPMPLPAYPVYMERERVFETVREVPVPFVVHDPALTRALGWLALSAESMARASMQREATERAALRAHRGAERAARVLAASLDLWRLSLPSGLPPATAIAASDSKQLEGPQALAPAPPEQRVAQRYEPVRVRQEGDHLTLETRGGSEDVVPGLIALLDDPDPEVAGLAGRQLETIRGRLTPHAYPGPDPEADAGGSAGLAGLFGRRAEAEAPRQLPGAAEWRRWWQAHGQAALGAEVL